MDIFSFASTLFAQAAAIAPAADAIPATTAAMPWWREGWFLWLLTLLTIGLPTLLAWMLASWASTASMMRHLVH
jgi:hypothetical protein